jgi:hypothetical protein
MRREKGDPASVFAMPTTAQAIRTYLPGKTKDDDVRDQMLPDGPELIPLSPNDPRAAKQAQMPIDSLRFHLS